MFKSASEIAIIAALAATTLGCDVEAPQYRFGEALNGVRFVLNDTTAGIHPSVVLLQDENNPFREDPIGLETKWEILAGGGDAATFYAWGTLLAAGVQPAGELQFYTAGALANIAATSQAIPPEGQTQDQADATVNQMAIDAYQSILDNFPDGVTFDPTGTISFRLATPAYLAILDLGGRPQGDWVLVASPNGGQEAVKGAGRDAPRLEPVDIEETGGN